MNKKEGLTLLNNHLSHDERMQFRIDALRRDLFSGEGDMEYVQDVVDVIYAYLSQYEDEDIIMSAIHVKEAYFYIANFNNY